jgi:hypothetical protein
MDKPIVKLSGQDGNVFNVVGLVTMTLKEAGHRDKAKEFSSKAFQCESYDAVLQLCFEYVEVE